MLQLVENCRKSKTVVIEIRPEVARGWGLGKVTMKEYEGCFGVMQVFCIVIAMALV